MYGIFSYDIASPRVGYRHGDFILDLETVALLGYFKALNINPSVFAQPVLNPFIALGRATCRAVSDRIRELLADNEAALREVHDQVLIRASRATLHRPVHIGDYTDFYAGIHHAENVGRMFRPDGDPLLANYRHMPVAYHGRSSSIVVSGTPIRRPSGQVLNAEKQPECRPSAALDFELELGLVIGKASPLGQPVPITEAEDYIFGLVLFNDWSARDIQRWEYQPLGPFLGKNFGSSMSAWVLPFHELEPVRCAGPEQHPRPLPYLQPSGPGHFDIQLEVWLNDACIARSNAQYLYWSFAQMIAHHTVNGCNLNVGDILATGTISGPTPGESGSLLEQSWNGTRPLTLPDGSTRTFLLDGDRVTMRAFFGPDEHRQELGEVTGRIVG